MTRWTRRLIFGAVAALVPALAGCEAGLNAPTLQYHPAANGGYLTQNGITVSNAFVLGPGLGSSLPAGSQAGVFLSLTSQNDDQLTSVTAPGTASSVTLTNGSVALSPANPANLEGPQPSVVLSGLKTSLAGGQTVDLVLNFANAGIMLIQVPVEPNAYEYATYSPPPPAPTPTPTASHKKASGSATSSPSASASPSPTG